MTQERLIKKYPNRRLYDTSTSKYVTLEDIRALVVAGNAFRVVEKKSSEDITRSILLQIIMEQETGKGEPMFSAELLTNFIKNYGEETQENFSNYMEQSLQFFNDQQTLLHEQMATPLKNTPAELWLNMGKSQVDSWQDMQKQLFETLVAPPKK